MRVLVFMAQRLAAMIPLLIGISMVSFGLILAVPGDYVDIWMNQAMAQTGQSRAELEVQVVALRERLGLDRPFYIQYWIWIKGIVLSADFGHSFIQSRPVAEMIGLRFWRTLGLAVVAIVFSQLIGVLLGIYAAKNQYRFGDTFATLFAFTGIVVPKFIVALVILYFLAFVYHSPYIGSFHSPEFILQDHFSWAKVWDWFLHVWPVILVFALVVGGIYAGWLTPTEGAAVGAAGWLAAAPLCAPPLSPGGLLSVAESGATRSDARSGSALAAACFGASGAAMGRPAQLLSRPCSSKPYTLTSAAPVSRPWEISFRKAWKFSVPYSSIKWATTLTDL